MQDALLLSRREAARALSVSLDTLARLVKNGEFDVVRVGRSVLIPRHQVFELIGRGSARTAPAEDDA